MREIILLCCYAIGAFSFPIAAAAVAEYGITGSAKPFIGGSVSHYVTGAR